jgi:hypothetical protein
MALVSNVAIVSAVGTSRAVVFPEDQLLAVYDIADLSVAPTLYTDVIVTDWLSEQNVWDVVYRTDKGAEDLWQWVERALG